MTVTIFAYNDGKLWILNGSIDLDTDTVKVSLHTATYAPNIDNDNFFDDITNELAASGGYIGGGETLIASIVIADDSNDRAFWDADDLIWSTFTPSATFRYGVIYKDTGIANTSALIAYIDFGADQNPAGSDFKIQWHADGILYI